MTTSAFTQAQPITMAISCKWTSKGGGFVDQGARLMDGSALHQFCAYNAGNADTLHTSSLYCGGAGFGKTGMISGTWTVHEYCGNNTDSYIAVNGGTTTTGSAGTGTLGGFRICTGGHGFNYAYVDISEIILINKVLSASERTNLISYMRTWSGI